jgi:hypothetical protein
MTKASHFWGVGDDDSTWENAVWSLGPSRAGFGHFADFISDPDLAERGYFDLPGRLLKWHGAEASFSRPSFRNWYGLPDRITGQWVLQVTA